MYIAEGWRAHEGVEVSEVVGSHEFYEKIKIDPRKGREGREGREGRHIPVNQM